MIEGVVVMFALFWCSAVGAWVFFICLAGFRFDLDEGLFADEIFFFVFGFFVLCDAEFNSKNKN